MGLIKKAVFLLILCFLVYTQGDEPFFSASLSNSTDCVILIHGLGRTSSSMTKLEERLEKEGYRVINTEYPGSRHTVEYLADTVLADVLERIRRLCASRVHFVTHSTGGIIVRYYKKHHEIPNLGRVVMLSPPNQGTELVDSLRKNLLFKILYGPAGQQLGTDVKSLPLKLGPVDFELGVIAGSRSLNPLFSRIIPGQDDGIVPVKGAKIEGMKDFLVLPENHTFIMRSERVIGQVLYFLEHGKFRSEKP